MKIIKIFGIVAGLHAIALLLILANPGCSSSRAKDADQAGSGKSDAVAPAPDAPPPIAPAPGGDSGASPAPAQPPEAPLITQPGLYSPTRPGTPAAEAVEAQQPPGVRPASTYTVAKGDTLSGIAKKNKIKLADLLSANQLKSGATLRIGEKLKIPGAAGAAGADAAAGAATAEGPPKPGEGGSKKPSTTVTSGGLTYVVRHGDSLGAIAHKYKVKEGDLATLNSISDPAKIQPGQKLQIPAGGREPEEKPAAAAAAPPAQAPAATVPPAAGQDLDAGLKPPPDGEVPTVKIDEASGPAPAPVPPKQP